MFDERALKELAAMEADHPILSVYLDVDPRRHTADEYRLALRDMLQEVEGEADIQDIEAVKRYVELEYDWSGRGLVFFACQAEGLWQVFTLSIPVRSGVTVARKPYISPLVELSGVYGRYVVALVDRQKGRFFFFHFGDVVAREEVMGEEIRRMRKGRGSSVVGMRGGAPASGRREAEIVQRNLREIADGLTRFCKQHRPRRLLLAGTEHTVAQLRDYLPPKLQAIIVGTFAAEMEAGEHEIREASLALLQELETRRKREVVESVVTAAAKGLNGVLGLDQTMSMAHDGRIQVLVVERDYHEPGYRCGGCEYLMVQPLERCPFCGSTFEQIKDAVEAVVSQVVEKGGAVEVVDNGAIPEARIGALLRY